MEKGKKKVVDNKKVKTNKKAKTVKVNDSKKRKCNSKLCIMFVIVFLLACLIIIILCDRKWVRNGNVISKGNKSYEIGDYYDYDESNNGEYTDLIDVKWKVMDVDASGNLLLISSSSVGDLTLGNEEDFGESLDDFLTGEDEMNAVTKPYGKGEGALYVRSANLNDIFQVFNLSVDIVSDFDDVAYSWGEDDAIHYKRVNEEGDGFVEGKSTVKHDGLFVFFDTKENEWNLAYRNNYTEDDLTIGVLKNNAVMFNRYFFNEDKNEYEYLYEEDTKAYKMMCKDERSFTNSYWLSNRYISANNNYASYGFNAFKSDSVNADFVVNSVGKTRKTTHGVRAVVAIK